MTDNPLFVDIAVNLPVDGTYTYAVPPELRNDARIGARALVPFGKRTITGFITAVKDSPPADVIQTKLKPIIDILDARPLYDEKKLKFFTWMTSYYFAPPGEVLSLICPAGLDVKSTRRIRLTPQGAAALITTEGAEKEILALAKNGTTVCSCVRRLKNRPVYSVIERLKKKGFLTEELIIKGGIKPKTIAHVKLNAATGAHSLKKIGHIQAKIISYLKIESSPSIVDLKKNLGNCSGAIKKLVEKGVISLEERPAARDPLSDIVPRDASFTPNRDQQKAGTEIAQAVKKNTFSPFLLYGITGSGKTLVYLNAIEETIAAGKKALYLVPEISLTPWPAAYLAGRFPGRVAVSHSGLTPGERHDEWMRIIKNEADVVVGARSALFSPIQNLGLIIVDEEHESSYKQEEGVRYNARDAALMLGFTLGITVVLGSATPSLESFQNARTGKIKLLALKNRVNVQGLPAVDLVDMRGKKNDVFSETLKSLVEHTLKDGNQTLLFLNRRGFSNFIICKDCGYALTCPNCSVTMTMHKREGCLKCHYCGGTLPLPNACPQCKGFNLRHPGMGTEKIEEEIRASFPKARTGRMDSDTTRKKGAAKKIIAAVEGKKLDVLIGTQMVSKGHHFPGITLVGVISGDTSLNVPDFRGAERTFQLITQAAGRAGRGEHPGRVVIQTLNPEHYCFTNSAAHDYEGFFEAEILHRRELGYPPFGRLCCIRMEGRKENEVSRCAAILKGIADKMKKPPDVAALGPSPSLIQKLKGRYRFLLLVKAGGAGTMHSFVSDLKKELDLKKPASVSVTIDMDPSSVV